jgi:hypothetical protein
MHDYCKYDDPSDAIGVLRNRWMWKISIPISCLPISWSISSKSRKWYGNL